MGNYLSDSGPNFKAGEVKLNSIPEYQYNKDMKKELKAGHVKKEDLAELYESMLVIREFEEMILKLKNGAYEILSDYEFFHRSGSNSRGRLLRSQHHGRNHLHPPRTR